MNSVVHVPACLPACLPSCLPVSPCLSPFFTVDSDLINLLGTHGHCGEHVCTLFIQCNGTAGEAAGLPENRKQSSANIYIGRLGSVVVTVFMQQRHLFASN